jgi:hypothetical protein
MKPKFYVMDASPEDGKLVDWSKAVRMTFPNLRKSSVARLKRTFSKTNSAKK